MIRREPKGIKGYRLVTPPHRIKLNQNESPYDLPGPLKEKILARMGEIPWNRYPPPFADSLAEKIAGREGWDPEGVVVAGGSNILIQAVTILSAVGGRILTFEPGFSLYEIEGLLLGNRVLKIPLDPDDFSIPLETLRKRLASVRPSVVFLANPNAPTGTLFPDDGILEIVRRTRGLVLVDEAYQEFSGRSLLPFLKNHKNLVLLRTLSKAFSLGGVRLGYLMASREIAREVKKVILPFSVGVLTQTVADLVLDEADYVARLVSEIRRERDRLFQALSKFPSLVVTPSAANFILFRTRGRTPGARQLFDALLREGILVRDVTSRALKNALRVTVGTPDENRLFLEALSRIRP